LIAVLSKIPLPMLKTSERSTMSLWALRFFVLIWLLIVLPACRHSTEPPGLLPDTTSHVLAWRTDTVGVGGSLVSDLAIIDANNIWAAGQFYMRDSTGTIDPEIYNVAIWDGTRWNPRRLYYTYQGTQFLLRSYAVFAFANNDIWLACEAPFHWDGHTLNNVDLGNLGGNAIFRFWGRSSNDLYAVGNNGSLSHFNGRSFQTIPTGVQSFFFDIFGTADKVFIGSYYYDNQIRPSGVFVYDKYGFRFLFPDASDNSNFQALRDAFGVWVSPAGNLWAVAEPFVFLPLLNHIPFPGINPERYQLNCIRGNSDADVWVGGVGGTVLHYNGATWRQYDELKAGAMRIEYHAVAVKQDCVVLGGISFNSEHAIITIGRRSK
jgi:hypothetical protein